MRPARYFFVIQLSNSRMFNGKFWKKQLERIAKKVQS